jgi:hypothetical protein
MAAAVRRGADKGGKDGWKPAPQRRSSAIDDLGLLTSSVGGGFGGGHGGSNRFVGTMDRKW